MALITCSDCGKQFSDAAAACPNCGRPHKPASLPTPEKKKTGCATWGCLTLLVVGGIGILVSPDTPARPGAASSASREPYVSKSAGEEAVRKVLKDPESARFSEVYVKTKASGSAVCGMVNAKNGFGGYTGDKLFFAIGSFAVVQSASNIEEFLPLYEAACTDGTPKAKRKARS
jgi:hypothetical protein